ncbi:outer membrane protein assembly factor [Phenylobacterium soli]|uniref:Outer membrane protein assembly factor n=2 Tax=Phenylobacterium soli TaxID=2170551 RepID=A0A328AMV6_9CAUL|nr:outer membrane protein assembly factor [Phenylobacterium soli]
MDAALRAEIVRAVGETDRSIDNRFEARRRANGAAEDAIAVLRSEGYYGYVVEPEVGDGDTPSAAVRVAPGPRFHLALPKIEWVGTPPDADTQIGAVSSLALNPGAPGRAADVVSAEGRAVAAVQKRGYADAKAQPREVVVDHGDQSVQPTYRLAAGKLVKLDGVNLTTNGRTRAKWVRGLAPWRSGELYDPEKVAKLERRLLDTGVYESVTVGLSPVDQTTADGLRPVVVSLAERKRRTLEVGASWGSNEGPGFDVRWTRYNFLGRADTLGLFAKGSKLDSRVGADLTLPHWKRPDQTLTLDAAAYNTTTDAYDAKGFGVRADAQRHFTKTSYLTLGGSVDFSRTDEIKPGTLTPLGRDVLTVAALADLALDRSNDPLDPRRGWRVNARAEPTLLAGKGTVPYVKLQTGGSAYFPFGKEAKTVLAARVHVGSILNGTVADIPAPQRFYAGGGGSVRGFAYQGVGPRLADNTPQGGLSLVEGSIELRHDLTRTWGLVGFVDAGAVGSQNTPTFKDVGVGAGVGVRYNLGFGPIRVDVAVPVSGKNGGSPFQVYVSIGQAF